MTVRRAIVAVLLFLAAGPAARAQDCDLDRLLDRSVEAWDKVRDLVCSFSKRERIRDGIQEKRHILFKFRKPSSFYMKMTEGDDKDSELIYVDGKYDNKLEVHLGGFWGFLRVAVDPRGARALKNHRHPVMDADPGHILDLIVRDYRKAKSDPGSRIACEGEIPLDGRKAVHATAVFPPGKGFYGHTVDVYIDRELLLPVKLSVRGWDNEFLEEYRYEDVRLNAGLGDRDFDTGNPEYGF